MLSTCASVEQLRACGLRTIKQQMYLRKLISATNTQMNTCKATTAAACADNKPTMSAMKAMSEEERRLYLIK